MQIQCRKNHFKTKCASGLEYSETKSIARTCYKKRDNRCVSCRCFPFLENCTYFEQLFREPQHEPLKVIQKDNEFEVEKVSQRAVTIVQDGDKIKYMCDKCKRLFANEANLDRHQVVHRFGGTAFTCPSCSKSFIDETRLRTHQETHCKSSVLISTLYRSDIAVFQCIVCTQVFSKNNSCVAHFARCSMNEEHLNVINNGKID